MNEDWWGHMLNQRRDDGRKDADLGRFRPPYPGSEDPQEEDENFAYEKGFKARRIELGENFKWRGK